jgi:hypothetical protein
MVVVAARWSGSEAMSEGQQQAHQQHNPQPLRSVHEPFEPLIYGGNLLNLLVGSSPYSVYSRKCVE